MRAGVGLGALLGSKGIKAIVVNADEAVPAEIADPALLKETIQEIARLLTEDPKSKNRKLYGTLDILDVANQTGMMPTRNFSEGSFEKADKTNWSKLFRPGSQTRRYRPQWNPLRSRMHHPMFKCFSECKRERKIVASLQYESAVMLGPNLGIGDVDTIGELNNLCNEVGLDSIECGAALGVAMEAGVAAFGDGKAPRI